MASEHKVLRDAADFLYENGYEILGEQVRYAYETFQKEEENEENH